MVLNMDKEKQLIQLMGESQPVLLTALDNLGDSTQGHINVGSVADIDLEGKSSYMPKHGSNDSSVNLGFTSIKTQGIEVIDEEVTITGELKFSQYTHPGISKEY